MWLNAVVLLLTRLAESLLREYLRQRSARLDLIERTRLEGAVLSLRRANQALAFKAAAAADPVGAGELRVRDGAHTVPLPGADPDPPRDPD